MTRLPNRDNPLSRRNVLLTIGSTVALVGTAGCFDFFGTDKDEYTPVESESEEKSSNEQEADEEMSEDSHGENEDGEDDSERGNDDKKDIETNEDTNTENSGDKDDERRDKEEEEEDGFEQYTNEEFAYRIDYPAAWDIDDQADSVEMLADDETAGIWIGVDEARVSLEHVVKGYREDFNPHPEVDILADDSVTLESGDDAHRFIIDMTEPDVAFSPYIAHELVAQSTGRQYWVTIAVSKSEYDDQYAALAETVLGSFGFLEE